MGTKKVEIKEIRSERRIFIDGKRTKNLEEGGIEVKYDLIRDLEFKELIGECPIEILYTQKNMKERTLSRLFDSDLDIGFYIDNVSDIEALLFVTVFDPHDLPQEKHESYQLTLAEIVGERGDLTFHDSLMDNLDEITAKIEYIEQIKEQTGRTVNYSAVGFVQFWVHIPGFVFKDIYRPLAQLLEDLDRETRKRCNI